MYWKYSICFLIFTFIVCHFLLFFYHRFQYGKLFLHEVPQNHKLEQAQEQIKNHQIEALNGKLSQVVQSIVKESKKENILPDIKDVNQINNSVETLFFKKEHAHLFQNLRINSSLLLGLAVDISPINFAIFCGSFRQNVDRGRAVIFMNKPMTPRNIKIAYQYSIDLIEFDMKDIITSTNTLQFHPSSIRWVLYSQLLLVKDALYQNIFRKVIVVDVRDTVFQSNPFRLLPKNQENFYAIGENRSTVIGQCGWNSGWVRDCFGEDLLLSIGGKGIICSGISLGTMPVMSGYIHRMANILLGKDKSLKGSFPTCERNGVDQGLHNVLIYLNQIPSLEIKYPDEFPVVNYQSAPNFITKTVNGKEVLMQKADQLFSIVHQYDRNHGFQQSLAKQYATWIDFSDPKKEWENDEYCQQFDYVDYVDLFKAKCDLSALRLISAASCCSACLNKNPKPSDPSSSSSSKTNTNPLVCSAFTFWDGICFMKKCSMHAIRDVITNYNKNPKDNLERYRLNGAKSAYLKISGH